MSKTIEEFKHNELLVQIMKEYLKIRDEETADLSIENLWSEYKMLQESNRLNELKEVCDWAITFYDSIGTGLMR